LVLDANASLHHSGFPRWVDADGNGELTLEELVEFKKAMHAK